MIFVFRHSFIRFSCSAVHRHPHCDAYTSLYLPLQFAPLPSLTKLPQSAHYHRVVSSQWFLQSATRSAVKQAKRAWSRSFALASPSAFRETPTYTRIRMRMSVLLSFSSSPELVGRATRQEIVLPQRLSFRRIFSNDQRITVFEW